MSSYKNLSDTELILLVKESDYTAYTEIYNRFFGVLYVFVYKRLRDEDDTKDVVQELFTHIWIKRETITIPDLLSAYLYTAVRNKMLDFLHRNDNQKKHIQSLQGFVDTEPIMTDYLIRERQLATLIEKEIDSLPKRMKEVFQMSRNSNMTYKEISSQLNLTPQSVKTYGKQAIKLLRLKLGLGINLILFYFFF